LRNGRGAQRADCANARELHNLTAGKRRSGVARALQNAPHAGRTAQRKFVRDVRPAGAAAQRCAACADVCRKRTESEMKRIMRTSSSIAAAIAVSIVVGCAVTPSSDEKLGANSAADSTGEWVYPAETRIGTWASIRPNAVTDFYSSLVMVHAGGGVNATDLWWGYYDGSTWHQDVQIPNQTTTSVPALSWFNDYIYMAYLQGTTVMMSILNFATKTWGTPFATSISSAYTPGIIAYNSLLYVVSVDPSTLQLRQSTFNAQGTPLTANQPLSGQYSTSPPSLALFNGSIYMVHNSGPDIIYNSFNGSWGADHFVPGGIGGNIQLASSAPVIASYKSKLHLFHNEPNQGDRIWWSEFDGLVWTPELGLNQFGQPAAAATSEVTSPHPTLIMTHNSSASNHAIFYSGFRPDLCSDGLMDNGETGVDCGGPCVACSPNAPPASGCTGTYPIKCPGGTCIAKGEHCP
jgi:hypothetical protein